MENHFVPVVHLKFSNQHLKKEKQSSSMEYVSDSNENPHHSQSNLSQRPTIIYSHGNCSDLEDSYNFVTQMAEIYDCDFIIYDYTGYTNTVGQPVNFDRKRHKLSQNSIVKDLMKVIEWSQIPEDKLILWGFSLGCYPTLSVASKLNNLGGVILQSPFASIYRLLSPEVSFLKQFKNDIFANIEFIEKVRSNILIVHSQDDDIIPFWHAESLAKRCEFLGRPKFLKLIELKRFGHNNLDQVLYAKKANNLQKYIKAFVKRCESDQTKRIYVKNQNKKEAKQHKDKFPDNPQFPINSQQKHLKQTPTKKLTQVPELELKTQASIEMESTILMSTKRRTKKLTLSRTFLNYNSKKGLNRSVQIKPIEGDTEGTIQSLQSINFEEISRKEKSEEI